MGLDAFIFCDCYERGLLNEQPRPEWEVYVDESGMRLPGAKGLKLKVLMAFDRWAETACYHYEGDFLHHRIGSIGEVALFRAILNRHPDQFPMILEKVIYDGCHAADFLTVEEVKKLLPEVERLSTLHVNDTVDEEWLRHFETMMRELVECSLRLNKPLTF